MNLAKHRVSGSPLSEAERRQRRNAARARWAAVAGAGALAGGLTAMVAVPARLAIDEPRRVADLVRETDLRLLAGGARRQAALDAAIRYRNRTRPIRPVEGSPAGPPVIGDRQNQLVYDFQIDRLKRQQKRVSTTAAARLQQQIDELERLKIKRPVRIGRRGGVRVRPKAEAVKHLALIDRQLEAMELTATLPEIHAQMLLRETVQREINAPAPAIPVNAHVEQRFRGGETQKLLAARIADTKLYLRNRHQSLLAALEHRTAHLRAVGREQVISDAQRALRGRLIRAGGRAGLLGAGLGLSIAGIGLLAHHVATSGKRQLAKATGPQDPQSSMAAGLAAAYRSWIDRLLGNADKPIQLGDDLAAALAPGLTQAFAEGATQPPVEPLSGPPSYRIDVDFDKLNPAVRRHMADYALDRIVEITAAQREAIRSVLMQQSVLQGIGPRDAARSVRQSIGLTLYQTGVVQRFRMELVNLDPKVFERKLRDKRYDRTIRRAIETNTPLTEEQIDAMVDAYHRRMLALRAETIARTESIRATSYGAVARAQDVLDGHPELDVIKIWIATDDNRTRDTHRDLDKKEVQGITTPFLTSAGNLLKWPVDQDAVADETINCRCAIGYRFIPRRPALQAVPA